MSGQQLRELRAAEVPKLVVYGRDDPQMNATQAAAAAARIGAPLPVAILGRHLTMVSSAGQLASAISALSHRYEPAA
jgi:pimeloyl-ACP methyl ester carboxylesterase